MRTFDIVCLMAASALLGCAGGDNVAGDRFGGGGSGGDDASGSGATGPSAGSGNAPSGASNGGAGDGGAASSSSHAASTGSGQPACEDTGQAEPNEGEGSAGDIGALDDCDGSGGFLDGVLSGSDVDWYTYQGNDGFGCVVDASRSIESDGEVRVCQFFDCGGEKIDIGCPEGTSAETSPEGRHGCCSQDPFEVGIDCPGLNDSANVYVRVDKPPAYDCVHYTLTLHY
jgi:hypothetical protein